MWSQELETILLVSDDSTVSAREDSLLEQMGYRVLTAKDELEATALYQDHWTEVSLVILDVSMPIRTFWELKRLDQNANILIVAHQQIDQGMVHELLQEGAAFLLANPYRVHKMVQAVSHMIQGQSMYRRKTA
jgi:two-component system, cell cycle sensor histidine kinase and response regulator CckA